MEYITEFLVNLNPKYLYTFFIIIFLFIIRWILIRFIINNIEDISSRYKWHRVTTYSTAFIGVLVVFPLWTRGIESILTFLGLFSAGLAIALRDVIINFFGWLYILVRRPFSIGDRVEINNIQGDVIDIKILEFTVMEVGNWVDANQSTGRIINIPNGKILNNNIANSTKGFQLIWNEIPITITFESNWKKAKNILEEITSKNSLNLNNNMREKIIHSAKKNYSIKNLTPIIYTSVADNGIKLTIRYLCHPRMRRNSSQSFWEDILDRFSERDDIEFAYPTYRQYNHELKNLVNQKATEGEVRKYDREGE